MKENPARHMVSVGRSFHSTEAYKEDLGFGITASRGFQHSLKPTFQGLAMCLDYSVLAFRKRLPVIDFLREHVPGFNLNDFRSCGRDVENALKGLKVTVTHRITKQKHKQPKNYVPMEFCVLVEGQIYPKENLNRDVGLYLKKISLATPRDRQRIICDMVADRDGPCGGNIIQNFGMEVDMDMTSVLGRVIGPPELKLSASNGRVIKIAVDKEKCHWNLVGKGVVEGKPIDRWVVIDFSSSERGRYKLRPEQFIPKLRARGQLQIIICGCLGRILVTSILSGFLRQVGVVTQCCLSDHVNNGNDQYFANLALKINAKLGGSNVELIDRLPFFEGEGHVSVIGADVNHPGARNKTSPSIAAVVATVNWPAANRYAARVRPQYHRKEKILNFGDMCFELVETYVRLNRVKPGNIVIFRDGVSEGQFDMVLNEELTDLRRAFKSSNYAPTITLIVAQKRHQTRLFPGNRSSGSSNGNVSPGTVVDTKIVHPFEFDFYLCSHYGSLGTSKPTHYHVLCDEHGFSSDQLQKLIYNMCYTFARCTKPVSLVPPVYYADLVAYRGRLYYEAIMDGQSPASASSSTSSAATSSLSSAASLDDRFYKLHAELENIMFFV
ncbi:hypothetical protein GH714_010024 [Hevea brasiliensis]|uniref:Piwi domain-containing protein n=1 Tax=Hevea brasiliensis TaxID=3981 RepID=A0A6A6LQT9_HEVBR|nr:hypothetical protein GH714_010024 [Hevea brasiliensis]